MKKQQARMPREKRRLSVRYGLQGQEPEMVGFTADVSPSGLFVISSKLPDAGSPIILEVSLPEQKTLRMEGWVAWTRTVPVQLRSVEKTGFGVRLDLPPEAWFEYVYQMFG